MSPTQPSRDERTGPTGDHETAPVCVIIPSWNGRRLLERCLPALFNQTVRPAQTVVVDNGSSDGTVEFVRRTWPAVQVVALPENAGFAAGCNRGIEAARGGLDVILLNNDATPEPSWLEELDRAARTLPGSVGVLSAKMIGAGGLIDSTGDFLNSWGIPYQRGYGEKDEGQYDQHPWIFSGCGGASLYRRRLLDDVGTFDEAFFAYYEDVDLCFRARLAGWDVALVPDAVVVHEAGATSGRVHGFRRYHATRNLWFLIVKNVPAPLLPICLLRVVLVQCWWMLGALKHRQLTISAQAHMNAATQVSSVLARRRQVQTQRRVSARDVYSWLSPQPGAVRNSKALKA